MANRRPTAPAMGGKWAVLLFVFTLLAFVGETQLSQYVQTTLGFRHPYFLFYVVHSSFTIMFPTHFLFILATKQYSTRALVSGLKYAITQHLSPSQTSAAFPSRTFLLLVLASTVGITLPALLWFASVVLASISDVTAIWNTNAFFAYLIAVKVFGYKWEPLKLVAVSFATLGVIAVVYGGSTLSEVGRATTSPDTLLAPIKPTAPLMGDLLTLVASVGYALYQVLYKKYVALPSDPEMDPDTSYAPIPGAEEPHADAHHESPGDTDTQDTVYPPPFGLHPNLVTSGIGLCTLLILWIPIPILHYLDIERFSLPTNSTTIGAIAGIAISGVVFNAGFMILLGVWGPIITSVGNLLTIVLVFLSDVLFGGGAESVTVWSLVGSGVIIAAFGVLAYDIFNRR